MSQRLVELMLTLAAFGLLLTGFVQMMHYWLPKCSDTVPRSGQVVVCVMVGDIQDGDEL